MCLTHHNAVELVGTVDGLVESEPLHQVGLHLKRVHVGEGLLGPRQNLEKEKMAMLSL